MNKREKTTPDKIYRERIATISRTIQQVRKKDLSLATLKVPLFLLLIYSLYRMISRFHSTTIAISLTIFIIFTILAMIHERIIRQRDRIRLCKIINENEITALKEIFLRVEDGEEFQDDDHAYSSDLDIFGHHSLFQYINRTTTTMGKHHLAGMLKKPTQQETAIRQQQDGIRELVNKIDFRQTIQCHGWQIGDTETHYQFLHQLITSPTFLPSGKFFNSLLIFLPLITLIFLVLSFYGVSWLVFMAFFLLQATINHPYRKKISSLYRLTSSSALILKAYGRIIREVEVEAFTSPLLNSLKKRFLVQGKQPASRYIRRLSSLFHLLQLRLSSIHFLINNIFMWDLNLVLFINRWNARVKKDVVDWFESVGRIEALSSFANISFNHPHWVIPEITGDEFKLKAATLGHPLIPGQQRICNTFQMEGRGKIHIITGPNMSGKSTFLKTVGINLVLAMCGSVVCAGEYAFSPVSLYSSMKVSDSLDQKVSLFYAELKRLKNILDGIENQEQVFFLIDEMLKGTNVLDRQKGAIALLKQLVKQKANGLVATHDLELAKLNREHRANIKNFHFDGYIKGDKLLFDYTLKKGTCRSFNALILMKKMGIQID